MIPIQYDDANIKQSRANPNECVKCLNVNTAFLYRTDSGQVVGKVVQELHGMLEVVLVIMVAADNMCMLLGHWGGDRCH